jgi:hypothetical protein
MEDYNRFLTHRRDAEATFLLMGLDILRFEANETWRLLGFDSMADFCEAPIETHGLGMGSYRQAQRLALVARTYKIEMKCDDQQLLEIGSTKLDIISPYVTEDNLEEMLQQAQSQSKRDLERSVRETSNGKVVPANIVSAMPVRVWPFHLAPNEFRHIVGRPGQWIVHIPKDLTLLPIAAFVGGDELMLFSLELADGSLLMLYGEDNGGNETTESPEED